MYVYLNDLSAEPTGFSTETILSLLKEFIGVFSSLRSYQIEKLRVPRGFKSENQIFGSITIKDLVISLNGDTDYDIRTRILTFLNNVEEARPSDHSERINLAQQSRLVEVSNLYFTNNRVENDRLSLKIWIRKSNLWQRSSPSS